MKRAANKTFVVTGASGYIGSHMCYELRQSYPNCKIVAIDKVRKHKLNHLYDDFVLRDLAKSDQIIFDGYNIDCIFHFAALASVPESESLPYKYYYNNILSLTRVLEEAVFVKVKNIIFSSTCAVYGPVRKRVYEGMEMNPKSVYAKSKVMCEEILRAAEAEYNIRTGTLRYFNAAGRNVAANLYEEHAPETHLIPNIMKNYRIDVYGNNFDTLDGTAVRDYIHVIDICKAHIKAYEYMEEKRRGLICNIGTGKGHSVLQVIAAVEKVTGKKVDIELHARRMGDVDSLVSDITKMTSELAFRPEHDIVSMIKSIME